MRSKHNGTNVLLVEILIAVLFFMLSATVLVRVFVTAHNLTVRSGVETIALSEAQNVWEAIYAAGDVDDCLREMDFTLSHGVWTREAADGTYTILVEGGETPAEAGSVWDGRVRAFYNARRADAARRESEELFALECRRYKGGRQ